MSDISKIEKLYSRFAVDFLGEIKSDEFYAYFDNMLRSGTANIALSEKYVERRIDLRWVEAIEQTIIPLDNIIRDPNRYIKNIEEIVPIEMARGISTEAVRHLATHTNMIAKVENGNVTPQKILNIVKEESFDTYENRFIYTLLFKLEYFLDKRLQTLMSGSKVADKYEIKMDGSCSAGHDEITGVLNGVASKFDFEGRSLVLPVAIKDIPEYFAYQNTTLGGISAMGVNNDIGQYAFYGCTALKSAEFPNAISLQQHAFNGCSSLFNLNLNALQRIEGGQTNGSGVGGHFKDCTSLVSLSFPSLTYIQLYNSSNYSNAGIFEGCTSLASVSFGSGFNQDLQARNMFKNTPSLTMIAFDGCPKIDIAHDCKISETTQIFVSYANYDAFISKNDAYRSVTQYYEIVYTDTETGITYYLKELPSGEYEITLIEIPTDFALEKVVLPSMYNGKNIISLNSSAWKGLENQRIKTVVLPNDLRFFNNKEAVADSVESFEISEENSVFSTVDGVLYSKDGSVLIAYPKSKLGDSFALPATVTMISSKAFSGTLNLVTLTIGHKVTICDEAFYDCMKLQNVVFTGTETSSFIGTQTFMDCDLENSITVWIPLGTIDSYKNAVIEDIDLYSKFIEGTPNT